MPISLRLGVRILLVIFFVALLYVAIKGLLFLHDVYLFVTWFQDFRL